MPHSPSRRNFLAATAAGLTTATLLQQAAGQAIRPATSPAPLAPPQKQPPDLSVPVPVEKTLGIAVVGLGTFGLGQVMPQLSGTRFIKPTALVSGHRDKAEQVGQVYGVASDHLYDYDNFDTIANDDGVDIVYIVLPNHMHAEYTIRALEAGKHVICEKPMAPTSEECRQMIAAAEKADRKLMVAYRLQFEPHTQMVKDAVQNQTYGAVKTVSASNQQVTMAPNIRLSKETAGGPLGDVGIYCINTTRFILGEEPIEVQAMLHQPKTDPNFREVPESWTWLMRFPSGVIASCDTGFGAHSSRRYRIHCKDAFIDVDPAYAYTGLRATIGNDKGRQTVDLPQVEQVAAELDAFAKSIMDDTPIWSDGVDGLRDMLVIEALYESARTGRSVKVKSA